MSQTSGSRISVSGFSQRGPVRQGRYTITNYTKTTKVTDAGVGQVTYTPGASILFSQLANPDSYQPTDAFMSDCNHDNWPPANAVTGNNNFVDSNMSDQLCRQMLDANATHADDRLLEEGPQIGTMVLEKITLGSVAPSHRLPSAGLDQEDSEVPVRESTYDFIPLEDFLKGKKQSSLGSAVSIAGRPVGAALGTIEGAVDNALSAVAGAVGRAMLTGNH